MQRTIPEKRKRNSMCADRSNTMSRHRKRETSSQIKNAASLNRPASGFPYVSAPTIRQFKHSRNVDGRLNSLCLRCRLLVGSADNEWTLLEFEDRHVCSG